MFDSLVSIARTGHLRVQKRVVVYASFVPQALAIVVGAVAHLRGRVFGLFSKACTGRDPG